MIFGNFQIAWSGVFAEWMAWRTDQLAENKNFLKIPSYLTQGLEIRLNLMDTGSLIL